MRPECLVVKSLDERTELAVAKGGSLSERVGESPNSTGGHRDSVTCLGLARCVAFIDRIFGQYLTQRPFYSVRRFFDQLQLFGVDSRAWLRSAKLDYLEGIADMVIQFGDGLHPLAHQLAVRSFVPHHLKEKASCHDSSDAAGHKQHVSPGDSLMRKEAVQHVVQRRNCERDGSRQPEGTPGPERFDLDTLWLHSANYRLAADSNTFGLVKRSVKNREGARDRAARQ
jgi:hypothetical protein